VFSSICKISCNWILKFDIRCFSLVTSVNGIIKAYFYRDGYIRTSSKEYSATNLYNKYVHLVNDAV
jgi:hypothetical protein